MMMYIRALLLFLLYIAMPFNAVTAYAASSMTTEKAAASTELAPGHINELFVGYDLYTLRPKAAATYSLNGFVVGYAIDFKILRDYPLYLGTGIDGRFTFRSKTFHDSATYDKLTAKVSTHFINFNVPLNLSYRFPVSSDLSFTPQFGFDFRIQALGRSKTEVSFPDNYPDRMVRATSFVPGNVNLFSKSVLGNEALKRFQFGWHAALKLQYDQFVVGVSYGTDFAKLRNELGSSNLLINFGYVF